MTGDEGRTLVCSTRDSRIKLYVLYEVDLVACTTSGQLKISNPQHSSGCGLRGAAGV